MSGASKKRVSTMPETGRLERCDPDPTFAQFVDSNFVLGHVETAASNQSACLLVIRRRRGNHRKPKKLNPINIILFYEIIVHQKHYSHYVTL